LGKRGLEATLVSASLRAFDDEMLRSMKQHVRLVGLVATLLGGSILFAVVMDRSYAIEDWLFWRYAGYWVTTLFWGSSCLSFGNALLRWWRPETPRVTERLTLGFALGVLSFGLAIFLVGLLHGLNAVTFFLLPAVFLATGARALYSDCRNLARRAKAGGLFVFDATTCVLVGAAAIAVGVLYFQILWPQVFSFDTRWYHMPIAQRYALTGAVSKFQEGYWMAAWPHLMSYLFAWAFLAPKTLLFDRIELCAHIEFLLFLATLAQIPVLLRRLLPKRRVGLAWTVMLAFPALYLYDANLHCDADHVAAFFAIPIAFTFFRALRDHHSRRVALFATFVAAAVLVKYTAISIALPFAVALFAYLLWHSVRHLDRRALGALGTLVGLCVVLTAPHWLKNWLWYGSPVYPLLHDRLAVHPWTPETPSRIRILHDSIQSAPLDGNGILEALKATLTFSFVPHDYWVFHRDVPVFGSLFTLTLPCLFFVREARRLWPLYAASMVAVFIWFVFSHYDRYLQAVLPWMAAATAGVIVAIWGMGPLARAALVPLVGLQLVWGADTPFFRTHNLIFDSPVRHVASFLPSGFEQVPNRFRLYEPLSTIGEAIPKNATVLAHDIIAILGIDRNWVADDHQSRISYATLASPRAIDTELKALGVTHLVWPPHSVQRDSLAGDLAFLNYAIRYTVEQKWIAYHSVVTLPPRPPDDARRALSVALFGCNNPYATGWYDLSQLTLPVIKPRRPPKPVAPLAASDVLDRADFVVVDEPCHPGFVPSALFLSASHRGTSRLYVRVSRPGR
jgi:hypothetical protein